VFEDRVEELARLLGVAVGQQLHRALQIGEEDEGTETTPSSLERERVRVTVGICYLALSVMSSYGAE
jgi:hypothetical protein